MSHTALMLMTGGRWGEDDRDSQGDENKPAL